MDMCNQTVDMNVYSYKISLGTWKYAQLFCFYMSVKNKFKFIFKEEQEKRRPLFWLIAYLNSLTIKNTTKDDILMSWNGLLL
jgi:hypothetical protein